MTHKTRVELIQIRWIVLFLMLLSFLLLTDITFVSKANVTTSLALATAFQAATIVTYVLVFVVCWNTFDVIRKFSRVMLAVVFFFTAIFSFLNTISFQDMPGFSNAGDVLKSPNFGLLTRYIIGATLLGLAIKRDDSQISNNKALGILGSGLCFTVLLVLTFFLLSNRENQDPSSFAIVSEIILSLLFILNAALFFRQANLNPQPNDLYFQIGRTYLFWANFLLALSQIFLLPYFKGREPILLVGHIFELAAALAIYRAMVTINIRAPYMMLANANAVLQATNAELVSHNARLTGIIETAIDGIITIDKMQKIIIINPAAATMFGHTVASLQGKSLEVVIPNRHRKNHGAHIDQFGKTGSTKRQMGAIFDDFYVTGLHTDGTEFPIEASISSALENGERTYTVIFRDITERKNARDKLALYHTQLSQLSSALQSIREEERKHIARELHDDLGQLLAALRMDLSLLQRDELLTEKTKKTVHSMDQLTLTSITTLRRIASDLRPRALDEGGLFYALKTLQKDFSNRHHIDCELIADEEQLVLDDAHSTAIFRVIQESLTNVARHAGASEVQIKFQRDATSIKFSIHDNGRGIDDEDMKKTRSFGLVGMRERIKAMQGTFTVTSSPGNGTHLEICLPLSIESDAQ